MSLDDLPAGWTVWNEEPEGRVILAYRPDVFNSSDYPSECLPVLYVTNGSRRRRPGAGAVEADEWHVTLFLEPEIDSPAGRYDDRDAAVEGAIDVADRFATGEVDYRGLYQVPREEYFEKLDELTGRAVEE